MESSALAIPTLEFDVDTGDDGAFVLDLGELFPPLPPPLPCPPLEPSVEEVKEDAVDPLLKEIVEYVLRPSAKLRNQLDILLNKILQCLTNLPDHRVRRIALGGSVGKGTSTSFLHDVNLVVFVNADHTSFGDLLDKYIKALESWPWEEQKLFRLQHLRQTTKTSICFVCAGYHFELCLAKNFVPENEQPDSDYVSIQKAGYLRAARDGYYGLGEKLTLSMVESQLKYFKALPKFVIYLIRLCKFWRWAACHFTYHDSTLSSVIETIALHVGANAKSPSLFKAFRSFLEMVQGYNGIRLTFGHHDGAVKRSKLDSSLILDPVNPYMDFKLREETAKEVMEFARLTLCRMDRIGDTSNDENLTLLFAPMFYKPNHLAVKNRFKMFEQFGVTQCSVCIESIQWSSPIKELWINSTKGINLEDLWQLERVTKTFVVIPAMLFVRQYLRPPPPHDKDITNVALKNLVQRNVARFVFGMDLDWLNEQVFKFGLNWEEHANSDLEDCSIFTLGYPLRQCGDGSTSTDELEDEIETIKLWMTIRYNFSDKQMFSIPEIPASAAAATFGPAQEEGEKQTETNEIGQFESYQTFPVDLPAESGYSFNNGQSSVE